MTRQEAKELTMLQCLRPVRVRLPRFRFWLQRNEHTHKLTLTLKFCLIRNYYHLVINRNYCGATVTSQYRRPGEDWLRGCDLKDGSLWELPRVLLDILSYERKPNLSYMMWQHWMLHGNIVAMRRQP